MAVITLDGQFGAGALEIGDAAAKTLKFDYVERAAIPMVARRVNATVEAVWLKENHACTWRERLAAALERMLTYAGTYGTPDEAAGYILYMYDPYFPVPGSRENVRSRPHEIPDDEYVTAMKDVNSELADVGELVLTLRGGCANLRDRDDAFHVGLFAPMDHRVARVANQKRLSPLDAAELVKTTEARRTDYFRRTLGTEPSDPELYHVVIHTDRVTNARAVSEIVSESMAFAGTASATPAPDPYGISDIQHVRFD